MQENLTFLSAFLFILAPILAAVKFALFEKFTRALGYVCVEMGGWGKQVKERSVPVAYFLKTTWQRVQLIMKTEKLRFRDTEVMIYWESSKHEVVKRVAFELRNPEECYFLLKVFGIWLYNLVSILPRKKAKNKIGKERKKDLEE